MSEWLTNTSYSRFKKKKGPILNHKKVGVHKLLLIVQSVKGWLKYMLQIWQPIHHVSDCRSSGAQPQGQGGQAQGALRANRFYTLHTCQEIEEAPVWLPVC